MQNPLVEKLAQKTIPTSTTSPSPSPSLPSGQSSTLQLEKDHKTGGLIVDDRFRARLIPSQASSPPPALSNDTNLHTDHHPQHDPTSTLLPEVFVIGDCAMINTQPALPKTAQVASQQAAHLARALNRLPPPAAPPARASTSTSRTATTPTTTNLDEAWDKPFRFRNLGTMTYLGNWRAIHQSSADRLTGYAAWILWRTAYLTRSMSWKNKVLIPVYVSLCRNVLARAAATASGPL